MNKNGKQIVLISLLIISLFVATFVLAARSGGSIACKDGIDNDGDTYKDYPADPGCSSRNDNNERGTAICDNGVDNDGDGATDYPNDPGCSSPTDSDETNCGDFVISGSEVCDGSNIGNNTCVSQGFSGGTLSCNSQCNGFVTSGCYTNSCIDSDTGYNIVVQGTTSGFYLGSVYNITDSCNGNTLTENYCSGNRNYNSNFNCSGNYTSCTSGACV